MERVTFMPRYTINFTFCDGNFEITVNTNHYIEAETKEKADNIAKQLVDILGTFIKLYYDSNKRDIIAEVTNNDFFDKTYISKFTFYDETKGEYLKKEFEDGTSLYPVANEECFTNVNKEHFIELIEEHYKKSLKDKQALTFEMISFRVFPMCHDCMPSKYEEAKYGIPVGTIVATNEDITLYLCESCLKEWEEMVHMLDKSLI